MAKETEIQHDDRFVTKWGEDYRRHPEFIRTVVEEMKRGRALWLIKSDLFPSSPPSLRSHASEW